MSRHSYARSNSFWQTIALYGVVVVIWSIYRLFFHTSVWLEETVIKGLIFGLPLLLLPVPASVKKQFGISTTNFFSSVYIGIGLGIVLGLIGQIGNLLRHQQFVFQDYGLTSGALGAFLILALITAFWEQLLFTGYFLPKLQPHLKSELVLLMVVGIMFTLIHVPAFIVVQHQTVSQILISSLLLVSLGVGCAILKIRQNNLIGPIMAHALWGVTIFLFR